ncbi:MAG: hypothetical protein ACOX3W_05965 [Christensenellaceae bacterium]
MKPYLKNPAYLKKTLEIYTPILKSDVEKKFKRLPVDAKEYANQTIDRLQAAMKEAKESGAEGIKELHAYFDEKHKELEQLRK